MGTRDEIEKAIAEFVDANFRLGYTDKADYRDHAEAVRKARQRLVSAIAPPAPGEVRLDEAVVQSLREFLGAFDDLPEMGFGDDYAMQETWDDLLNLRLAINLGPLAAAAAPEQSR